MVSLVHRAGSARLGGHVGGDGVATHLCCDLRGTLVVDVGDRNPGTGLREQKRGQSAAPISAADDQRRFSIQTEDLPHCFLPPCADRPAGRSRFALASPL